MYLFNSNREPVCAKLCGVTVQQQQNDLNPLVKGLMRSEILLSNYGLMRMLPAEDISKINVWKFREKLV